MRTRPPYRRLTPLASTRIGPTFIRVSIGRGHPGPTLVEEVDHRRVSPDRHDELRSQLPRHEHRDVLARARRLEQDVCESPSSVQPAAPGARPSAVGVHDQLGRRSAALPPTPSPCRPRSRRVSRPPPAGRRRRRRPPPRPATSPAGSRSRAGGRGRPCSRGPARRSAPVGRPDRPLGPASPDRLPTRSLLSSTYSTVFSTNRVSSTPRRPRLCSWVARMLSMSWRIPAATRLSPWSTLWPSICPVSPSESPP